MGFLGTAAGLFTDVTLIIQIIGFILLFAGTMYVKSGNMVKHIRMAEAAVILGVIALIWMADSFLSIFPAVSLLTGSHAVAGSIAMITGILFVFNKLITKTRMPMRIVFTLWTVAFLLGLAQYYTYYV